MKGPMGSEVGDTHLKPSGRIHPGCHNERRQDERHQDERRHDGQNR